MFNKNVSTPIAILIIVVITVLAGGIFYWQYKQVEINISSLSFSECTADSDCEYLECPSRNELGCNSAQNVKGQCMSGECKCKCVTPEYELAQPPSGKQLVYQGKVYVKSEQKYNEPIPEKYQVELEEGVIYDYKDDIYTLKAADPHHDSYIYTKWQPKPVGEPEIDVSDWEIFSVDSDEHDISFKIKYPSFYKEDPAYKPCKPEMFFNSGGIGPVLLAIKDSEGKSLSDYVQKEIQKTKNNKEENFIEGPIETSVAGRRALRQRYTMGEGEHSIGVYVDTFIKKESKIYAFKYNTAMPIIGMTSCKYKDYSNAETAERIISTFEFTE